MGRTPIVRKVAPPGPIEPAVAALPGAPPPASNLDRLIHEPIRLGIVSALAGSESLTFTDLKRLLGTTDGNLSVHARKLEDAGYIVVTKPEGRQSRTSFRLSPAGRNALQRYLDHMEALIERLRG